MRRGQKAAHHKRFRFHRKPLLLPYSSPPRWATLHLDPSLRTAAELAGAQYDSVA
jgi:hypothetical protein